MPCERIPFAGGVAIVCSRGRRRQRCATPGCGGDAVALCDFPLAGRKSGTTCSRAMCARCVRPQGESVDYCAAHAKQTTIAPAAPETWK